MKQKVLCMITLIFFLFLVPEQIYASEDYLGEIMDELDLDSVDENMKELPDKLTFSDLVKTFVEQGTDGIDPAMLCDYIFDLFFYEFSAVRPVFIEIVCISLLFSLYGKVLVTGQKYVSQLGFFVVYTGILMLLLESFSLIGEVVESGVGRLVSFMTAFIPTYAATLLLAGNMSSASAFYGLAFGIIYLLELGMKFLFLPGIHVYVLLMMMDNLFEETKLSKLAQLLEDGIHSVLKIGLAAVVGLGVVQSLIAPAKDRLSTSGFYHGLSAIPGIGNTFGATGEILVGCGIMIKNSLGVAALVILFVICLAPVLKVFSFHVMYRLVAAVLMPFCDKRIAQCVHDVGKGCGIYLKLLLDAVLLFFITVSMITASSSFIY